MCINQNVDKCYQFHVLPGSQVKGNFDEQSIEHLQLQFSHERATTETATKLSADITEQTDYKLSIYHRVKKWILKGISTTHLNTFLEGKVKTPTVN